MYDSTTSRLLVAIVLGIIWRCSESNQSDYKLHLSSNNTILETLTRFRRAPQKYSYIGFSKKCRTPSHPRHGNWTYIDNSFGEAYAEVEIGTTISFTCYNGYKLSTTNHNRQYVVCVGGDMWSAPLPSCEQVCKPYYNSKIITYTCKKDGYLVQCDKATDGTIKTFTCASYYESILGSHQRSTCFQGEWDFTSSLECVPVCGNKKIAATPLIVGGRQAKRGSYPWVTALYKKNYHRFDFICAGSLISFNVVLTAAHCVTKVESGEIQPPPYFRVGAGTNYIRYKDFRDRDTAKYVEVEDIKTHQDYKGEIQNFRGDIALLKLKTPLSPSESIQPACFIDPPPLQPKSIGLVTGWGYTTETGQLSDTLKELELPVNDARDCFDSFEKEFAARYLLSDKMCAGYNNQNTSICRGDSGGGLMFKNPNYRDRYFIYGIASLSETFGKNQERHCKIQSSALFTKVEDYNEWIQLQVQQWNSLVKISKNCTTPDQIDNGQWTYQDNRTGEAYVPVPVDTIIRFTCNYGYQLPSSSEKEQFVHCVENGEWSVPVIPTCKVTTEGRLKDVTTEAKVPSTSSAPALKPLPDLNHQCLRCICHAASACIISSARDIGYFGPYRISRLYWIDAGKQTLPEDDAERDKAFEDCAVDYDCAQQIVISYVTQFAKDCNNDNVTDCEDYMMTHFNGGWTCELPLDIDEGGRKRLERFRECDPKLHKTF